MLRWSWLVFILAAGNLGAQGDRVEAYAQKLAAEWAKDGVKVVQGIQADGRQSLAVLATGGYFPMKVKAQAGVPSVLRIYTHRTYDCSRSFMLPDQRQRAILPADGVKEFPLPAMKKGQVLFGTCSMGMYTFKITFE